MGRPGVMFYFDVRPCIKRLSESEKGRLFEAILDYAQFGVIPEVDGMLGVAWDFIQPKIDRDSQRYENQVAQRQYATYVREVKRDGGKPLAFGKWEKQIEGDRVISSVNETERMMSPDNEEHPTTTTATTTATATTTPTATTTDTETNESRGEDKPPIRPEFSPPDLEEIRVFCQENGYRMSPEAFVDYYAANGWMVGRNRMKDWKAAVRRWERKEVPDGKLETKPRWQVGNVL